MDQINSDSDIQNKERKSTKEPDWDLADDDYIKDVMTEAFGSPDFDDSFKGSLSLPSVESRNNLTNFENAHVLAPKLATSSSDLSLDNEPLFRGNRKSPEVPQPSVEVDRDKSESFTDLSSLSYLTLHDNILDGLLGQTMLTKHLAVILPERIIIRSDHTSLGEKVKLLSGGCAGHDPLFTGFVGCGMLTAAVYGDETGGPTPKQIIAALRELRTPRGILIIIRNDLNERLNFGLAMERARSEGILVDMVAVRDDCWENQESRSGRKCLSGIIGVIKVAGAMSEAKKSMKDIFIMCRAMILTSLSAVIPADSFVRFGTDLKGLGGKEVEKEGYLVKAMVQYMVDSKKYFSVSIFPLNKFIVILNCYYNDRLFLGLLSKELVHELEKVNICVERMYCGNFISGPFPGFCFTLIKDFEEELLTWFDAPVSSNVWPASILQRPVIKKITFVSELTDIPEDGCRISRVKGPRSTAMFQCYGAECLTIACEAVISSRYMLNKMDPVGHYGTIVAKAAKVILEELQNAELDFKRPFHLMNKISVIMEDNIMGATGTMYALLFSGIGQSFLSFSEQVQVDFDHWVAGIKKGISSMAAMARIKVGDCTLIDALYPFFRGLIMNKGRDTLDRLREGVERAEDGAHRTIRIHSLRHLPYLPEPGAQTVATVLRAIYESVKAVTLRDIQEIKKGARVPCPIGIVEIEEPSVPTYIEAEEEEMVVVEAEEEEAESIILSDEYEIDEMMENIGEHS